MHTLTLVSLLAENARPLYRALAGYLAQALDLPVRFVEDRPWQAQERMLDAGEADLAFLCGLLYTQKADRLELLAAPVAQAARYGGRPSYYSDVVVRQDSHFAAFADLRGAAWAFNDPGSFSGYAALRAHLAELGAPDSFCGRWVESGGHLRSLALVAAGTVDAAAIDSLVFDLERANNAACAAQLRVVASIGPSPAPPAVAARHLPPALRKRLRMALLGMHTSAEGRAILAGGLIARFASVADADYDDIRAKAARAAAVELEIAKTYTPHG